MKATALTDLNLPTGAKLLIRRKKFSRGNRSSTIGEFVALKPISILSDDSLVIAFEFLKWQSSEYLVVVNEDDQVVGVISAKQIAATKLDLLLKQPSASPKMVNRWFQAMKVEDVMTPNPTIVKSSLPTIWAYRFLMKHDKSYLVVKRGKNYGILTPHSILFRLYQPQHAAI